MGHNFYTCQKRNQSVIKRILNRQIYGADVQQDVRMIRTMIGSSRSFKRVCEICSKLPIAFEGERLYLNSYSTCFDLSHVSDRPRTVYSHLRRPAASAVTIMHLFECPLDETTFCKVKGTFYANGPYSIGLTRDNYLKIFDYKTGNSLQEVFLLECRKFRYLFWESELERFAVQSTSFMTSRARLDIQSDILLYIAIFESTPLRFLCMLPISYSIFGRDVCNASVCNGLLIVMRPREKVQFFDLEDILKNHTIQLKLGETLKAGNKLNLPGLGESVSGIVGKCPVGLPVNVMLPGKPPVLLELISSYHNLSLGGYPWHYIANINDIFHVRSIKDHTLAENGIINDNDEVIFAPEKVLFHADKSGRILHVAPSYLRCLKLCPNGSHFCQARHKLNQQFILDYREPTRPQGVVHTKSGRTVKQLLCPNQVYPVIEILQDFDYDDELDLLVVLGLDQSTRGRGFVSFYDNQTGHHVHSFGIPNINEQHEHSIAINRNILVIVSKNNRNKFRCLVYHLVQDFLKEC